jgi:ATP-dependent HslUV protease subunit HslV
MDGKRTLSTTVIVVAKDGKVCMASDGQVTLGSAVIKRTAKKVRKIFGGKVLVGFAGAAADGLALMERLERKLEEYRWSNWQKSGGRTKPFGGSKPSCW